MAKSKYDTYTHAQLVEELKKLSKRKKYGLVWEEVKTKEKFEAEAEGKLPVLTEDKKREIKGDKKNLTHILIEGDNYHALSVLNYTHSKSIDVIYIDPPYNTGSTAWKYNNDYVDREDAFRHSKWISLMSKRIKLAKYLLTNKGIIVCAIDDYEVHNLRHLLDEIFGYDNRLSTITVIHNPGGRQDDKFVATAHEYMLLYAKNKEAATVKYLEIPDKKIQEYVHKDKFGKYKTREFRRSGSNSRRKDRPKMWYPIYINKETLEINIEPLKNAFELLPIDQNGIERVWRWGKESLMKKKDKYIEVRKNGKENSYALFVKERHEDNKGEKPKSIWNKAAYSATNGTSELKKIFGDDNDNEKIFDYPKSPALMYDILKIITNDNSIVLDFFAGSGTTGQAVLQLNKNEGGNRQFILCSNNEVGPKLFSELKKKGLSKEEMDKEGVCQKVTYPRIKKVIKGYKFNGVNRDILLERKITMDILNNADEFIEEIEQTKNKQGYPKYQLELKEGVVKLYGVDNKNGVVEGLSGNLKYYKTNFVGSEPTHRNKKLLTEKSIEMLCIRENTFEEVLSKPDISIFRSDKKYTAILFDEMKMEEFKKEIKKLKLKVSVYVFSLEGDDFSEDFEDLKNSITLCSIPEAILKVYRRIYETAKPKR